MKEKKNILLLILLLVVTVVVVLVFARLYNNNSNKKISTIFESVKEITPNDFNQYMLENPDIIIYIASKNDLSNEEFINDFLLELDKNNLREQLICIDKNLMKDSFISNLKEVYDIDLDASKLPALIVIQDRNVEKISYINENTDITTVIDYQVLE